MTSLGVLQRLESYQASDWAIGKPVQLDCNDCVVTAVGQQRLNTTGVLPLTDKSLASSKEVLYQVANFEIIGQKAAEDGEILNLRFYSMLQLEVGRVVLASLTVHFNCNMPRIHSVEFDGYSSNGIRVIDQPLIWVISRGLSDYGTYGSVRVWIEFLVQVARPVFSYRFNIIGETRSYDEVRIIEANGILDVAGYQLRWGREE